MRPSLPPTGAGLHHAFCSQHNEGALELLHELAEQLDFHISTSTDVAHLGSCQCMLVLLDGRTWTSSSATALAEDVEKAMALRVRLLLVHEMPSLESDAARHAVDFGSFFSTTPARLIEAGIYSTIATPLKSGMQRRASLVMLALALRGSVLSMGVRWLSGWRRIAAGGQRRLASLQAQWQGHNARRTAWRFRASQKPMLREEGNFEMLVSRGGLRVER